jgi:hypothetical protein
MYRNVVPVDLELSEIQLAANNRFLPSQPRSWVGRSLRDDTSMSILFPKAEKSGENARVAYNNPAHASHACTNVDLRR